jgi:hypothetical protein
VPSLAACDLATLFKAPRFAALDLMSHNVTA